MTSLCFSHCDLPKLWESNARRGCACTSSPRPSPPPPPRHRPECGISPPTSCVLGRSGLTSLSPASGLRQEGCDASSRACRRCPAHSTSGDVAIMSRGLLLKTAPQSGDQDDVFQGLAEKLLCLSCGKAQNVTYSGRGGDFERPPVSSCGNARRGGPSCVPWRRWLGGHRSCGPHTSVGGRAGLQA